MAIVALEETNRKLSILARDAKSMKRTTMGVVEVATALDETRRVYRTHAETLTDLVERLAPFLEKARAFEAEARERFDAMDRRFADIDGRFADIDGRLAGHDAQFREVQRKLDLLLARS